MNRETIVFWAALSFTLAGVPACTDLDDASERAARSSAQSDDERDNDDGRDDGDDGRDDGDGDGDDGTAEGVEGAPGGGAPGAGGTGAAGCDLGGVTVENFEVPSGATCALTGTRVTGNLFVRSGGTLLAQSVIVGGNLQAEGAKRVDVQGASRFEGSVQIKQGGSAQIVGARVNADLQLDSMAGALAARNNVIGGSLQAFQNRGGLTVNGNQIDGNLQCKENSPAPSGGGNVVQGNKEDQCAGL
jgi:hypothetical protein